MPGGIGIADFVPFVGYGLGAGESIEGVGQAKKDFEAGNYGSAALNYALSSLGLLPGAIGATAFHGTPNKVVDKFNLNKVGTGEGAQAYGHGIYFAESPMEAQKYMGNLDEFNTKVNNEILDTPVLKQILRYQGNPERYINSLEPQIKRQQEILKNASKEEIMPGLSDFDIANMELNSILKNVEEAKSYIGKDIKSVPVGNFYKVDIPDADIPKMLDWDKPFNQQTPEVRSAFNKLYSDPKIADSDNADWFKNIDKDQASMSGMYSNLATSDNLKGAKDVSRLLSQEGVTGVRYLDEGSRGAGKGTSNFVTFNPEQVKILEENGINYDELMKSGLLGN
jgi:hypothetical protein